MSIECCHATFDKFMKYNVVLPAHATAHMFGVGQCESDICIRATY